MQQTSSTDVDKLSLFSIEDAWVPFEHCWQPPNETPSNDWDILDPSLQVPVWNQYPITTP